MGVNIVLMSKFPAFSPWGLPSPPCFATTQSNSSRYIPPRQNWPSGGPRASSPLTTALHPVPRAHLSQQSEGSYYEDVDPRFSPPPQNVGVATTQGTGMVPAPLMPGGGRMGAGSPVGGMGGGGRRVGSPAGSERSEGRWGGGGGGGQQGRRNVLDGNADFALPGGRM